MRAPRLMFGLIPGLLLTACGGGGGGGGGGGDAPGVETRSAWARSAPGTGTYTTGKSTARLPDDSVIVAGLFDTSVSLGGTTLSSDGTTNGFLARYGANGDVAWAKKVGSSGSLVLERVAALAGGGFAVAGWFSGSAVFAPGEANQATLTPVGATDGFVATYGEDGSFRWARQVAGGAQGLGVAGLTDGSLVLVGTAWGASVAVAAGRPDAVTLTPATVEALVAKFSANGALLWAEASTSSVYTAAWSVAPMPQGGFVVLGDFQGAMTLGLDTGGNFVNLTSMAGGVDVYLAAYDGAGTTRWARQFGSDPAEVPDAVATSSSGTVYAVGTYEHELVAGAESPNPEALMALGNVEALWIVSYDVNGTFRWLRGVEGTTDPALAHGLDVYPDGGVALTGRFEGTLTLGLGEVGQTTLLATELETFLARLTPSGELDWLVQVADTAAGEGYGVAALSDGSAVVTGYFGGTGTWGAPTDPLRTEIEATTGYEAFVARFEDDGTF